VGRKPVTDASEAVIAPWREPLLDNKFILGCPIAATVVNVSSNDQLHGNACAS
jgi:hypothetical protein